MNISDGLLNGSGNNAGRGSRPESVGESDISGADISSKSLRSRLGSRGHNAGADGASAKGNRHGAGHGVGEAARGGVGGLARRSLRSLSGSRVNSLVGGGERARGSSAVDTTGVVQVAGVQAMHLCAAQSSQRSDHGKRKSVECVHCDDSRQSMS